MSNSAQSVRPVKPTTQIVSCEPFAVGPEMAVLLTTLSGKRGCTTFYKIARIDCPDLAFSLTKFASPGSDPESESYAVNLSMSTCECLGFLRWGKPCKHIVALRQLFEKGVIS